MTLIRHSIGSIVSGQNLLYHQSDHCCEPLGQHQKFKP